MLDSAVHKRLLISVLKDIFTDLTIAPYLGFKGGTAAMLFYDLPRFSVDLDFDLLDETKEEVVLEHVHKILAAYGTVTFRSKRYSLFFLLSYKDKVDTAQNIKVEINKRQFGSDYEVKSYLGIPMRVMIKQDMVAHKLVVMYERIGKTNRDIFDVWFFLHNNWPINKRIVEQRTGILFKLFLQDCIDELDQLSSRGMLSGLGELLNNQQKVWVKEKLKDETVFLLKLLLQTTPG